LAQVQFADIDSNRIYQWFDSRY